MAKRKNEVGWREMLSLPKPDFEEVSRRVKGTYDERGIGIVLACMVEDVIADLIGKVLDKPVAQLLSDRHAGLDTFSAKIKMGRALRLYGDTTLDDLNTVGTIRNKCAHVFGVRSSTGGAEAVVPLCFSNEPLHGLCERLQLVAQGALPLTMTGVDKESPLRRYQATCAGIGSALLRANWQFSRITPVLP